MKQDALNGTKGKLRLLTASLVYQAVGMILTLLAVLLLAILISHGAVSPAAGGVTALCCVPGAFTAGFLTARRAGRRILPMGLLSGGLFFLLLLLIGSIFLPELDAGNGFPGTLAACLAGGVLGALCTVGMRRR